MLHVNARATMLKRDGFEAQGLSTAFIELVSSEFTERLALHLLSG
jgi:hypothetical protein